MTERIPGLYPDELLYSLAARFFVHNGFLAYRQAAENLFLNAGERPDLLFLNRLKPEIKGRLEEQKGWERIITEHTMYPYYGRFLDRERQKQAFTALCGMKGGHKRILSVRKNRPLRYCPACAREDRKKYGETYWHRSHQMEGVRACPIHGCCLEESSVVTGSSASPSLAPAELAVQNMQGKRAPGRERELAAYAYEVFQCGKMPLPERREGGAGRFLDALLCGTGYRSRRGEQRNISLLAEDYGKFWGEEKLAVWQIEKILAGYRFQTAEICGLAMFLGAAPGELAQYQIPEGKNATKAEEFDSMVRKMLGDGTGINETARQLGVSSRTVRDIRDNKGGMPEKDSKKKKGTQQKKKTKKDWTGEDAAMLPKVKEMISVLMGETGERPRRVTLPALAGRIGIPEKRLEKLESCMEEIRAKKETKEEYWARELAWAARETEKEGKVLNWRRVRDLTNMRKPYAHACLGLLDAEMQKKIQDIL